MEENIDQQNTILTDSSGELPIVTLATSEVEIKEPKNGFWAFLGKNFLAMSILASGLMISGSLFYSGNLKSEVNQVVADIGNDQQKVADVSVDDDPFLGKSNAPIVMIEFSDYQCPFCRTFWSESFSQLKKEYIDTGKVKFVYRDYPLPFHPMSQTSAEASECADEQGKYWDFHNKIFSEEAKLGQGTVTYDVGDIKKWASEIGLNMAQFNGCVDSGKYKDEVGKDYSDGTASGVSGTPSFFINGRLIIGAQPYSSFKSIIDSELKK